MYTKQSSVLGSVGSGSNVHWSVSVLGSVCCGGGLLWSCLMLDFVLVDHLIITVKHQVTYLGGSGGITRVSLVTF